MKSTVKELKELVASQRAEIARLTAMLGRARFRRKVFADARSIFAGFYRSADFLPASQALRMPSTAVRIHPTVARKIANVILRDWLKRQEVIEVEDPDSGCKGTAYIIEFQASKGRLE